MDMTELDFWLRKTEVEIEEIGVFRSGLFDGEQCYFDIEFEIGADSEDKSANTISIYNIERKLRKQLVDTIAKKKKAKDKGLLIKVSSGYITNFGNIMWGRVQSAKNVREASGDVRTEIEVQSTQDILSEIYIIKTYNPGDSIKKFFEDVATVTGFQVGEIQSDYTFEEKFDIDVTKSIRGWMSYFEQRTKDKDPENPCKFVTEANFLNLLKKVLH
jgi:hypothetical protein